MNYLISIGISIIYFLATKDHSSLHLVIVYYLSLISFFVDYINTHGKDFGKTLISLILMSKDKS